jgi:signal transduction histidine kinase
MIGDDKRRVQQVQVFLNLLSNALKFMPEAGPIDLGGRTARRNRRMNRVVPPSDRM